MRGWVKHKLESRLLGEISITLDMQMIPPLRQKVKRLLKKMKEESKKTGLKFNIYKTKAMVSGPITSWQIDMETMETMRDFSFLGSKITADGEIKIEINLNFNFLEIKGCLLLRRKDMTNLDRVLKSRDIILPTKVHLVKAMLFPVVMHGCESWNIKKAEPQRLMLLNCGVGEGL